uniref:Uncharacterized protein n=1 Tax=Amphiprion percula TaxID=161767 RepID=A0A3P8SD10_AMPPE
NLSQQIFALKVIIEHQSEKLTLSSGIPSTVEQLHETVKETFGLIEEFTLHYLDEDFGDYFTLHSTNQIKHKGTIKVVIIPSVVDSSTSATDSGQDIMARSNYHSTVFCGTETILRNANEQFAEDGAVLTNTQIKSEIMEKLADYMYRYTAYPTSLQIGEVAEALVRKHPCLTEPGSRNGWIGWMYSLNLGVPEVTCNSLKNKHPDDKAPAKNIKKAKKGEVVFLPHYSGGNGKEQQELDRQQLIAESKKKDSTAVRRKMDQTFPYRRYEVVRDKPMVEDFKTRWSALFDVTVVRHTLIYAASQQKCPLGPLLDLRNKYECIINFRLSRCMLNLILTICVSKGADETNERSIEDTTVGIYVLKEDCNSKPDDIGIVIEDQVVLQELDNFPLAVAMFFGLIYTLNLDYPQSKFRCSLFVQQQTLNKDLENKILKGKKEQRCTVISVVEP